jgi:hypothetical protein
MLGQLANVILILTVTALMALVTIGATMLVDLLPIPAMHASSANHANTQVTLKSSPAN